MPASDIFLKIDYLAENSIFIIYLSPDISHQFCITAICVHVGCRVNSLKPYVCMWPSLGASIAAVHPFVFLSAV